MDRRRRAAAVVLLTACGGLGAAAARIAGASERLPLLPGGGGMRGTLLASTSSASRLAMASSTAGLQPRHATAALDAATPSRRARAGAAELLPRPHLADALRARHPAFGSLADAEATLRRKLATTSTRDAMMGAVADMTQAHAPVDTNGDPSVGALLDYLETERPPSATFESSGLVGEWLLEYTSELPRPLREVLTPDIQSDLTDIQVVMSISSQAGETGHLTTTATVSLVNGESKVLTCDGTWSQVGHGPRVSVHSGGLDDRSDVHVGQDFDVSYIRNGLLVLRRDPAGEGGASQRWLRDQLSIQPPRTEVWRRIAELASTHEVSPLRTSTGAGRSGLWRFGLWLRPLAASKAHQSITGRPAMHGARKRSLLSRQSNVDEMHSSPPGSRKKSTVIRRSKFADDEGSDSRTYALRSVFQTGMPGGMDVSDRLSTSLGTEQNRLQSSDFNGARMSSTIWIASVIGGSYALYPFMAEILAVLPRANAEAGADFFQLVSIAFGTLAAATVSDASARLGRLRAMAVEEVTMMLPVTKILEVELSDGGVLTAQDDSVDNTTREANGRLFRDCMSQLWEHTNSLIAKTRVEEKLSIATGKDPLVRCLVLLQGSQERSCNSLRSAIDTVQRLIEARGSRLSLENAGIPAGTIESLRAFSVAIPIIFAYINVDPEVFHFSPSQIESFWMNLGEFSTVDFGRRILYSCLVGALAYLIEQLADLNAPFRGFNRIESGTLVATLLQLRTRMASYLDIPLDAGLPGVDIQQLGDAGPCATDVDLAQD